MGHKSEWAAGMVAEEVRELEEAVEVVEGRGLGPTSRRGKVQWRELRRRGAKTTPRYQDSFGGFTKG